jgi:epoxyqueuosine reductase
VEGTDVKVALHACCGPCLIEPLDALAEEHEVTVVFANPNIQPADEYELRRDALREWAASRALETVEVLYDPAAWEEAVRGTRDDSASRCPRCYALRMRQAAAEGARLGCDALATTLSVSPYQDPDAIDEAGRQAAAEHGLVWLFEDYRPRYPEATRRAREEGMYRQNYCGCLPSKAEAEEERKRRRAERARR